MPATAALTLSQDELAAWLRLALTPGVGGATPAGALRQPRAIFTHSTAALQACVNANQAAQLQLPPPDWAQALATTWAWLQDPRCHLRPRPDHAGRPTLPPALLQTADPPLMLYTLGPAVWLQRPITRCWTAAARSHRRLAQSHGPRR